MHQRVNCCGYNDDMLTSRLLQPRRLLVVLATILILAGAVPGVAASQSGAPGLLSHRAVYSLSRQIGSTASDSAGVKGRLEITFEVACDGWRMEQYIVFWLYDAEGD